MPQTNHQTYLETQIRTATPQKCRLLLIEGAIRFARQALEWCDDEERAPQRYVALGRCNEIITELSTSIRVDALPVAAKVKAIYQFLLVQLAELSARKDPKILRDVIGVLEEERETWRQVCDQLPEAPAKSEGMPAKQEDVTAAGMSAILPQTASSPSTGATNTDRFSLEA